VHRDTPDPSEARNDRSKPEPGLRWPAGASGGWGYRPVFAVILCLTEVWASYSAPFLPPGTDLPPRQPAPAWDWFTTRALPRWSGDAGRFGSWNGSGVPRSSRKPGSSRKILDQRGHWGMRDWRGERGPGSDFGEGMDLERGMDFGEGSRGRRETGGAVGTPGGADQGRDARARCDAPHMHPAPWAWRLLSGAHG
jgi:hypothetical protein